MNNPAVPFTLEQGVTDFMSLLEPATELYSRLILVVRHAQTRKRTVLKTVAAATGGTLINVGLTLTTALLAYEPRQLPFKTDELLSALVRKAPHVPVLLDNIDILFDRKLAVDPMVLLQKVSRSQTLIVAWRGVIERGTLHYAKPGLREWRTYPVRDLLVVDLNRGQEQ